MFAHYPTGGGPRFSSPGDVDGDGDVDPFDLAFLLSGWGDCGGGDEQLGCIADLNGDGAVNPLDLAILLGHWTGAPE